MNMNAFFGEQVRSLPIRQRNKANPTFGPRVSLPMRDNAEHYRQRAAHRRELAEAARDDLVIQQLMELAADFEKEADRLDGENELNLSSTDDCPGGIPSAGRWKDERSARRSGPAESALISVTSFRLNQAPRGLRLAQPYAG